MHSYLVPWLVRTAVLAVVSAVMWFLADVVETSDGGLMWLVWVLATLAGIAAVWGAVDGVRGGRRGYQVRIGLLVWLSVAAATGLLQIALFLVQDVLAGRPLADVRLSGQLRVAFHYMLFIGVPAALTFGLAWIASRSTAPRSGR